MRNVILVHAREDAALAEALASFNPRIALLCAIEPGLSAGRFGPQFHMAALWTRTAAAAGIEFAMADALADRERDSFVVVADASAVPACLAAAGLRLSVRPDSDVVTLFDAIAPLAVDEGGFDEGEADRMARRRAAGLATTAALSIGCGALLAHAASPFGLVPTVVSPAFTPTSRIAPPVALPADAARTTAAIETVSARVEQIRAAAAAVNEKPAVRARFQQVKELALSDQLLSQLASRAEAQSAAVFAAAPVARPVVAAVIDPAAISLPAEVDTSASSVVLAQFEADGPSDVAC